MCCNHGLIRYTVMLTAMLLFAAGGVVIWGGKELKDYAMMRAFEKYHTDWVGLAVIAMGGLMAIVATIGFLGAKYKIGWCVGTVLPIQFCVVGVWIGLVRAAAGAGTLYFQAYLQDHLTRNSCSTTELLQAGDDAEQTASTLLCTYLCPCDYTADVQKLISPYGYKLIKGSAASIRDCIPCEGLDDRLLSPDKKNEINAFLSQYDLNLSVCLSLSTSQFLDLFFTNKQQQVFPLLSWLQDSFSCAGLCTSVPIYCFSDVNNGASTLPTEPCFGAFLDWVDEKSPIYGGVGLGLGGLLLVFSVFSTLLCCLRVIRK